MLARICVRLKWICSTFPIEGGEAASLTGGLVELLQLVEAPTLPSSSPEGKPGGKSSIAGKRGQPPLIHKGGASRRVSAQREPGVKGGAQRAY